MNAASVVKQTAVQVDRAYALHLLRQMLRIRRFEEKSAELYSATKIRGFLHLYIGEEAVAVGVMAALRPEDAVVGPAGLGPCPAARGPESLGGLGRR